MKQYFNVQGSQSTVSELEINVDTVYIRSNITRIESDGFKGWQYDEVQYTKDEYLSYLANRDEIQSLEFKLLSADERYKQLNKSNILLEDLKKYKIEQLKELCSNAVYEGFDSSIKDYSFYFNPLDQSNFTQQLLLIVASNGTYSTPIQWKTKDMRVVELTATEFTTIVSEAEVHKRNQQNIYWELEKQVLSALDNEVVESINWV